MDWNKAKESMKQDLQDYIERQVANGDLNDAIHILQSYGNTEMSYEEAKQAVHSLAREYGYLTTEPQKYEGYCEHVPYNRGEHVCIPKGTVVTYKGEEKTIKRTRTVIVEHVHQGTNQYRYREDDVIPMTNPTIVWAGSGGYWVTCDINQLSTEDSVQESK